MKYLNEYKTGDLADGIYVIKSKSQAVTKAGKPYYSMTLQDKTGTMESKIWNTESENIKPFEVNDFVEIKGEVTSFNNVIQIHATWARKCSESEYDIADYIPVSKYDVQGMYDELRGFIDSVKNAYLHKLLVAIFVDDKDILNAFLKSSAAMSIHHSFVGGLIEHTLSVTRLCSDCAKRYESLNRDLLITAAICHDIGKTRELSEFPANDFTDEGTLLGHIVIGIEIIDRKIREIGGFPPLLANELKHCVAAHHGELAFGSPKKPSLIEAVVLSFMDNTDAKIAMFNSIIENTPDADANNGQLGYNRYFETYLRKTEVI